MNPTVRSENIVRRLAAICCFAVSLSFAQADELKEARVTQVVKDVKLLPEQAAPRPASVNDPVRDGTAVRTGVQSRSELTFTDRTITRLGANTIFSFKEGTRIMDLGEGAILFQVPKGEGGATIRTAAVTAAITGTTGIGEFHHVTANNPHPVIKWLCLEGTIHLYLTNGSKDSVVLHPGQMEVTDGTKLSTPVDFDIAQLVKTSLLVIGFDTPLPSLPLITIEIQRQLDSRLAGGLNGTLLALNNPADIADQVDRGITAQNIVNSSPSPTESPTVTPTVSPTVSPTVTPTVTPTVSPTITPIPTPSKFGTLTTIASSDPYVITSGTVISTDPSITTNGHTDFGKIYRDPAQDGALSAFLFGSTSTFDTASGFDSEFTGAAMGGAAFKFTSLRLTGDPMISTAGGAINLGLIAVDGITSGGSGGVLTFAGIRGLLLATQNGSIDLGPEISFSGLHDIVFYARGSGSMLTLASDVTTTNRIRLYGESGIQLSSDLSTQDLIAFTDGDFDFTAGSIDAETISIISGGDLNFSLDTPLSFNTKTFLLEAGGNLDIADSLEVFGPATLTAMGAISVSGDLTLTLGSGGDVSGNLLVQNATGDTTVDGAIDFVVDSTNGGNVTSGGNITLAAGHDLAADSLFALIENDAGGTAQSPTLITSVTGDLTTNSFIDLFIANTGFNDDGFVAGGNITSNATIGLHAGNINCGDFLQAFIFNDGDGSIGGNALISSTITNDLTTKSDAFFDIQNSADTDGESLVPGGMIGGNATVNLSVGGDVNAGGVLEVAVLNNDHRFLPTGGTISGDATVAVIAGSIFAGGFFQPLINNTNGSIGGDATVSVHVTGNTSVGTEGFFRLTNDAGNLGGDAHFAFFGGNVSIGDTLFAEIQNRKEGEVGGDAVLAFHANNLSVEDTANFQILNGLPDDKSNAPGGLIGGDAIIGVQLANITAPVLVGDIDNTAGGSIGGDATVTFAISGSVDTTAAAFGIFNNANGVKANPGSIGGQALISFVASGDFTTNTLSAFIDNRNGGSIGTAASIFFNVGGGLTTSGDALFQISGGFEGAESPSLPAGGPAPLPPVTLIEVNADTLSVGGNLDSRIETSSGTIIGDAAIDMNVSGSATVTTDATFQILGSGGATSAAINFNGGSYDVGGTFLAFIDGDGTIRFNNASAHADVLKAGVFGTNGVLNIGGGTLSADTTLKLYAPGSNGQLNFISDVTLGGNSAKILAANAITIFDGVVVTVGNISDENPAAVYTNHANYTGFGGNASTTGTFAGSGANDPLPLDNAPPFGTSVSAPSVASHPPAAGHPPRGITHSPNPTVVQGRPPRSVAGPRAGGNNRPARIVTVRDSDELISLIERTTHGDNGHAAPRDVTRTNDRHNPTRTNVAGTTNIGRNRADIGSSFSPSTNRLP